MRIIFYGGRQAGAICLLTLLAREEQVVLVIPQDEIVESIAKEMKLAVFKPKSINSEESEQRLNALNADLLVCVHGRQIVKKNILGIPKKGCINAHPCLYKYKGADPIERLLADKETKASVGIHEMTEQVDGGKVIEEIFIDVSDCKTVVEVYNKLYPVYSMAVNRALDKIG